MGCSHSIICADTGKIDTRCKVLKWLYPLVQGSCRPVGDNFLTPDVEYLDLHGCQLEIISAFQGYTSSIIAVKIVLWDYQVLLWIIHRIKGV